MDDDDPLIRYDIDFRKRPKLLMGSPFAKDSTGAGAVCTGVTETFEDGIEWNPHVDEADKLDYCVTSPTISASEGCSSRYSHSSRGRS